MRRGIDLERIHQKNIAKNGLCPGAGGAVNEKASVRFSLGETDRTSSLARSLAQSDTELRKNARISARPLPTSGRSRLSAVLLNLEVCEDTPRRTAKEL